KRQRLAVVGADDGAEVDEVRAVAGVEGVASESGAGILVGVGAEVAGEGGVGNAAGGHGVDRLGDHAVLEKRFLEVKDVVGDELGVALGRIGKVLDALREGILAEKSRGEGDARAGRQMVYDLRHRPSLVGAAGRAFQQHIDATGGKVAAGDVGGGTA